MSGGAQDGSTLAANRTASERWQFVPRELVGASERYLRFRQAAAPCIGMGDRPAVIASRLLKMEKLWVFDVLV